MKGYVICFVNFVAMILLMWSAATELMVWYRIPIGLASSAVLILTIIANVKGVSRANR